MTCVTLCMFVCWNLIIIHLNVFPNRSFNYFSQLESRFYSSWTYFCETVSTFSLWISLRRCEILTLMASSSSSGTCGMVRGSASSGPWKVSSVRGMYHLLSYCWFLLQGRRKERGWRDEMSGLMKRVQRCGWIGRKGDSGNGKRKHDYFSNSKLKCWFYVGNEINEA